MPAIIADHLCKSYPLYARPSQKLRDALRPIPDIPRFEALKDISFTLQEGETLGVLGVNGAGQIHPAQTSGRSDVPHQRLP